MMRDIFFSLSAGICLILFSCKSEPYPRPRSFPRIDLPKHAYETWTSESCPFTFESPTGVRLLKQREDSCVVDFYFSSFNYFWHFTYRNLLESKRARNAHEEEYLKLVMKHAQKMEFLDEIPITGPGGWGTLYELKGDVGAPYQLIFGDSVHLLMTSFYFQEALDQDSLQPLVDYVKEDLLHMVATLHWR